MKHILEQKEFSLTPEKIKKISQEVMLQIHEDDFQDTINEFESILCKMKYISQINTDNIPAMTSPLKFHQIRTYLREDKTKNSALSVNEVLQNAPQINKQKFIIIPNRKKTS